MKDNLFVQYIEKYLPVELGVDNPKSAGECARAIFLSELSGQVGQSGTARERAALCMPYQVPFINLKKREHALDILELCILQHRKIHHDENHAVRIAELSNKPISDIEKNITAITRDFWNG